MHLNPSMGWLRSRSLQGLLDVTRVVLLNVCSDYRIYLRIEYLLCNGCGQGSLFCGRTSLRSLESCTATARLSMDSRVVAKIFIYFFKFFIVTFVCVSSVGCYINIIL